MPPKKDDKKAKPAGKSGGGGGKAKKKVRVYLPTTTHQPVHVVGVSTAAKRGWKGGAGGTCRRSMGLLLTRCDGRTAGYATQSDMPLP